MRIPVSHWLARVPRKMRDTAMLVAAALCVGVPLYHLAHNKPGPAGHALQAPAAVPTHADFGAAVPSPDARQVADWITATQNNRGMHFVILDKRNAALYVFDSSSRLVASTPVLLGAARGDDSVAGIGERPIAQVRPEERTTPAGRFVAQPGLNADGEDVVWVDYDAAVSMHRLRANNPKERRLERLATPTVDDNRISYGCINVPKAFYEDYIGPSFNKARGIVYVLPEVKQLNEVFADA